MSILSKNELAQSIIWPVAARAKIILARQHFGPEFDPETGEVTEEMEWVEMGEFKLDRPMTAFELAKLTPADCCVRLEGCIAIGSGGRVVRSSVPFDTVVNPERRNVTPEERMLAVERRVARQLAQLTAKQDALSAVRGVEEPEDEVIEQDAETVQEEAEANDDA